MRAASRLRKGIARVAEDRIEIRQEARRRIDSVEDRSLGLRDRKVLRISSDHSKHRGTKLAFLGTSLFPGRTDSCLLIKNGERCLVFNCGDNVYRELQRASYLEKQCTIFIASMNLNNIVGLPGLLSPGILPPPVIIYGPQGLRQYVRATLRACFARVPTKYAVHELITDNNLRIGNQLSDDLMHEDELYGDDLVCSGSDSYQVIKSEQLSLVTWPLGQTTQSWGFLYKETEKNCSLNTAIALISQQHESKPLFLKRESVDVLVHDIENNDAEAAGSQARAMNAGSLVLTGCSATHPNNKLVEAKSSSGMENVMLCVDHTTLTVTRSNS